MLLETLIIDHREAIEPETLTNTLENMEKKTLYKMTKEGIFNFYLPVVLLLLRHTTSDSRLLRQPR